jgi:hypothetical protein
MSCGGNRFQCGITRFQKHSFTSDKPSNPELHNENQIKLSEMMRMREEQDKGIFQSQPTISKNSISSEILIKENKSENKDTEYTPWSIPSASQNFEYIKK